jgi:hypothetical protein
MLTPRWFALKPHPTQYAFFHSPARFNLCTSGRRSGKTELRKRSVILSTWRDRFSPSPNGRNRFFAAPTRDQAKFIYWKDLKALMPRHWLKGDPNETELSMTTKWDTTIRVVGLDKAERIEGGGLDEINVDEFPSVKPGTFDGTIRPMLMDRKGRAYLYGKPFESGPAQWEYEQMVERAKSGADADWRHFNWPSSDIVDPAEVENARGTMDAKIFRQEMLGEFVTSGGKFAPDFDYKLNTIKDAFYNPNQPLCWSLDFNINPQCSGILQHENGRVTVLHEFALPNCKTEVVCSTFLEYCEKHLMNVKGVHIYGDSSGNARDSTSGLSDWVIVQNMLKNTGFKYHVKSSWSPLADTRNAVNARVLSARGTRNLFVDQTCIGLIGDLRGAIWPSDLDLNHHLAWLRYFCHSEYPVVPDPPERTYLAEATNARD